MTRRDDGLVHAWADADMALCPLCDRHVQRPMGWAVTVKNKGPRDRVPALLLLLPAILVGYIAYYLVR